MPRALQMMNLANGGRRAPTYMHPDMFASRAVKANDGRLMPMEDIPSEQDRPWAAQQRHSALSHFIPSRRPYRRRA